MRPIKHIDFPHCIPTKQNEMKFDWKNFISFVTYKSFQRLLISFENASNQTYERKYLQNFQSKLMISVNFSNQTSFQLFHWNEIRETKFDWKFFHSKFIWLVWLEEFTDIINFLRKFSQYFLSFVWLDIFKGNY